MAIRDWPEDTRPREKLLKRGAASLTDAELVIRVPREKSAGTDAADAAEGGAV